MKKINTLSNATASQGEGIPDSVGLVHADKVLSLAEALIENPI